MFEFDHIKKFILFIAFIICYIDEAVLQFNPYIGVLKFQCKSINSSVYEIHSCRTKKLKNGGTSMRMNYTYLLPMRKPFMVKQITE